MKLNTPVAKLLRIEIVDHHRSPQDAIACLRDRGIPDLPCWRTVYVHTHHGDLDISPSQLHYKPCSHPAKKSSPRRSLKMPGSLSIEERPDIEDRVYVVRQADSELISVFNGGSGKWP